MKFTPGLILLLVALVLFLLSALRIAPIASVDLLALGLAALAGAFVLDKWSR